MGKLKRGLYTMLAVSMLVFPLAGCGNNDEDESDKGKEENGVHKPKDDTFSTDEKEDMQEQEDQ